MVPFQALKENVRLPIEVLIGMQDVASVVMNPTRHAGHYASLVRAMQESDQAC